MEWAVQVQAGDTRVPGRLCAVRKSEEAIARAQRRLDVRKQQLKAVGTPETREYANHIIVFTTMPAKVATRERYLKLSVKGRKPAVVGVAHAMAVIIHRTLSTGTPYSEPDKAPDERQTQRLIRHHVRRLGKLGVAVSSLRPDTARQNKTAGGTTTRQIHPGNPEPNAQ